MVEAPDLCGYCWTPAGLVWHRGDLMLRNATGQVVGPCKPNCLVCEDYFSIRPQLPGLEKE